MGSEMCIRDSTDVAHGGRNVNTTGEEVLPEMQDVVNRWEEEPWSLARVTGTSWILYGFALLGNIGRSRVCLARFLSGESTE